MAFRRLERDSRRLPLVSLIDLIFILLIFFIITSVMIKLSKGESQLYIPTPKNEPGEAQVLIQIIDADHYLWLDHTAIDALRQFEYDAGRRLDTRTKIAWLVAQMTIDRKTMLARLEKKLEQEGPGSNKEYFVLIRCPDDLPYHLATSIIEKFVDNPFFEYGCVSGTLEEILNSKRVTIEGNVLQIDF